MIQLMGSGQVIGSQIGFSIRRDSGPLVTLLVATIVIFLPTATMQRFFYHNDVHYYFYPHQVLAASTIQRGELPLWNAYEFAGMPLAGDGQTGLYYPPYWVCYIFPAPEALNATILLQFWIAAVGAYLFARVIGLLRGPALLTALVFGFGGFPAARVVHLSILGGAALVPWVFLSIERWVRTGSLRWVAWTGIAVALQIAAGHPQIPTYTAVAALMYAIARETSIRRPGGRGRRIIRVALGVVAGYIMAACLAALLLLPWAECAAKSPRAAGASYSFVFKQSMQPADWLLYLFPRLFGSIAPDSFSNSPGKPGLGVRIWEHSAYVGILPLGLAVIALLQGSGKSKGDDLRQPVTSPADATTADHGVRIPLALVLAGSIVLAAGSATYLSHVVYAIPILGQLRDPARALILASFALSVLAGLGLQYVLIGRLRSFGGMIRLTVVALVLMAIPLSCVAFADSMEFKNALGVRGDELNLLLYDRPNTWVPVVLSLIAAGLLIWWAGGTAGRISGALAVAFVATDVGYFAATFNPTTGREFYAYQPGTLEFLKQDNGAFRKATFLPDNPPQDGLEARELLAMGWPLTYQVEDINGFNSLQSRRYTDYLFSPRSEDVSYGILSDSRRLAEDDPVLHSLNVKYVLVPTSKQPPLGKHLRLIYENDRARVYLNTACWPRAFFPESVRAEPNSQVILAQVTAGGYDARKETYVEDEGFIVPVGRGPTQATVARRSNDRIEIETVTDSSRLLVLSEVYAPGWRAYIDGKESQVVRVNYLFRGVVVPAGHHTVRLVYRPTSLIIGSLISVASWLGIAVMMRSTRRVAPSTNLLPEGTINPVKNADSRLDREEMSRLASTPSPAPPNEDLLAEESTSAFSSQPNRYTLSRDRDSSHRRIAGLVLELGRSPILDVGTAQGVLGQLIAGAGLVVDGVEPDLATRISANAHYNTIYVSLAVNASLPDQTYPVIVCADVLEHTADPIVTLHRLRRAATTDATFLVSVPNIGHIAARPFTLIGWFPKMERGIFDRTHRHFYVRGTAEAMLRSGGLKVLHAFPTPAPLEKLWPAWLPRFGLWWLMGIQRLAIWCLPGLFAYQWVFVAVPFGERNLGDGTSPP